MAAPACSACGWRNVTYCIAEDCPTSKILGARVVTTLHSETADAFAALLNREREVERKAAELCGPRFLTGGVHRPYWRRMARKALSEGEK